MAHGQREARGPMPSGRIDEHQIGNRDAPLQLWRVVPRGNLLIAFGDAKAILARVMPVQASMQQFPVGNADAGMPAISAIFSDALSAMP